ncbi:ATP-binding protein [Sneathiella glossodoripedis]|uniref:ATP-binding protein n=1 Tax=Sneathiella glossodoripedis TaxID=418853 RepID=UPI000470765B|nr:ATP-binding protein [Sneathiella glossodoripedis]
MKLNAPYVGLLKKIMPRTLFGRSLLIVVLPTVLLQILATYIFYERHWNNVARRLAQGVSGEIASVISLTDRFPGEEAQASILNIARSQMRLTVTFEDGYITPYSADHDDDDFGFLERHMARELRSSLPGRDFTITTNNNLEIVIIRVQLADKVLNVTVRDKRLFSNTTYIFVLWMIGISITLLAIAVIFLRNQMRPIRQLANAAEQFGKGQQVADFKPSGAQEIRLASIAFHEMKHRILRQIKQRTEMLAGVSHDLRTPLTRMKLQLAMMEDNDANRNLIGDVEDMKNMVEGYLAFAKGQEAESVAPVNLKEIVQEVCDNAARQGADITLTAAEDVLAHLRPNGMKRCLTNLIENARRHAQKIEVQLVIEDDQAFILIDDDGPGIPEDKRADVFRPFHRLDTSRNTETGGSGLGMTIARDVVHGHGGQIILATSPLGGLRVQVSLPL